MNKSFLKQDVKLFIVFLICSALFILLLITLYSLNNYTKFTGKVEKVEYLADFSIPRYALTLKNGKKSNTILIDTELTPTQSDLLKNLEGEVITAKFFKSHHNKGYKKNSIKIRSLQPMRVLSLTDINGNKLPKGCPIYPYYPLTSPFVHLALILTILVIIYLMRHKFL